MAEKWDTTSAMDKAIAKLQEQVDGGKLTDWGYKEHLAMIRYMAVDAYLQAQSKLPKLQELGAKANPPVKYTLEDVFRTELRTAFADGKLAECANFKKALQELGTVPKQTKRDLVYE